MTPPSPRDPGDPQHRARFSESVNRDDAVVRCTGHLSEQGADLVLGAVEVLRREGHEHITVDLHAVASADETALSELRCQCEHAPALRGAIVLVGEDESSGG